MMELRAGQAVCLGRTHAQRMAQEEAKKGREGRAHGIAHRI